MLADLVARVWRRLLRFQFRVLRGHRVNRLVLENIDGIPLLILPDVFNPTLFVTGELFIRAIKKEMEGEEGKGKREALKVLDMGVGSGVLSIAAARCGGSITAVDLNPSAVRCARINALLNDVPMDVRRSDLFQALPGEKFDLILFSPPLFRGTPKDNLHMAFYSDGAVDRFLQQLTDHLTPDGRALLLISDMAHFHQFDRLLLQNNLLCETVIEHRQPSERYAIVRLKRGEGAHN